MVERLAERYQTPEEPTEAPRLVTASLGLVAVVLVATSTIGAVEAGKDGIAVGFLSAVVLFMGAVTLFEVGRRLGSDE